MPNMGYPETVKAKTRQYNDRRNPTNKETNNDSNQQRYGCST